MNELITQLIATYREHAIAHGEATLQGKSKSANISYHKLVSLLPKIRAHHDAGETELLALTDDQDDSVACWSATHSLKYNENKALSILNVLAEKKGPIGFGAKMVVEQWKKGQLVLP